MGEQTAGEKGAVADAEEFGRILKSMGLRLTAEEMLHRGLLRGLKQRSGEDAGPTPPNDYRAFPD